jgi:hypothetical protein
MEESKHEDMREDGDDGSAYAARQTETRDFLAQSKRQKVDDDRKCTPAELDAIEEALLATEDVYPPCPDVLYHETTTDDSAESVCSVLSTSKGNFGFDGDDADDQCPPCKPTRLKRRCETPGCNVHPNFANPGEKARFCNEHKGPDMVDVKHKRCECQGCEARPTYANPGEKARFCNEHKGPDMVDVVNKRCECEGCEARPTYANPGEKARFCNEHKGPDMVDVVNKRCECEGCEARPTFANPGERPRFCNEHKGPDMVDVNHKRCECQGCEAQPTFANPGERPRFCNEHKGPDMVDVRSKRCEHEGCPKQPNFANPGERPRFCNEHKGPDMVDVRSKRCEHEGCEARPTFANRGERPRFCNEHKGPNMVDVKHKRCEECETRASYGVPGLQASRCANHKLNGMINPSRSRCETCKNFALFGIRKPQRCETHRLGHDVNLVERPCISCGLVNVLDAEGKCNDCAIGRRGMLAKQNEVMQFLDANMPDLPPNSTDRVPLGLKDCGDKERPDRLWETHPTCVVILEVDENQHKERNCACEQTRMVNIANSLGAPQTVFVRYNPDAFEGENGWTQLKRHNELLRWLRYLLETSEVPFTGTIGVLYLFFDGYRQGGVEIQTLLDSRSQNSA